MSVTVEKDVETRERLLTAATRLFADHGFAKVTVRDICDRAKANVAAVNYHFGGKVGLYEQVLRSAITTMRETTHLAIAQGAGQKPEAQLRIYVQVFVKRIVGVSTTSWIHQLMKHEMADPTPALDLVIDQVIRPRMEYLHGIVGGVLGRPVNDPRVVMCAMSVHSQCIALFNTHIGERIDPQFRMTPERLDAMVEHITRFSLAGIKGSA